jgi:BASS family bile acid:Na+ symporter
MKGLNLAQTVVPGTAGAADWPGLVVIALLAALAVALMASRPLRTYAFTAWVFVFVAASMFYPAAFGTWFGSDLKILIVPLIQVIMFGMGTTLSLADFGRVLAMPWPVLVGFVLQFSIMPCLGFTLATAFGFEPEIAAGVVLIGSAPGGVASNVMTYLARANVALSVTMTACSTLASPLMTPLMMKLLAGRYVEVSFWGMMVDICNMILVPILAGLLANRVLYGRQPLLRRAAVLAGLGVLSLAAATLVGWLGADYLGGIRGGLVVGFLMFGVVVLAKLVVDVLLHGPENWMDKALPVVSMSGICLIIGIITARSAEDLRVVGLALVAAAMLHNGLGYLLGYWGARLCRLREGDCRTVAIEVGMQNGGMASALAMNTLHSVKAALAPAIFGPWMNVSASVLATWWRRRPPESTVRQRECAPVEVPSDEPARAAQEL